MKMRKIRIIVGQEGITLTGDVAEVSCQLDGSGWIRRRENYFKHNATMDEVNTILRIYGDPSSANKHTDRNITIRTDPRGNIIVEGDTSFIGDHLRATGGIWSPHAHCWTFQSSSRSAVDALMKNLIDSGVCDTRVTDLTWNVPLSPLHFRNSPMLSSRNDLTDTHLLRQYSGDIPSTAIEKAVIRDGTGKIISVSGIPIPGVMEDTNITCSLCEGHGHTRMDCVCPFCRYINLHNPRDCPSQYAE